MKYNVIKLDIALEQIGIMNMRVDYGPFTNEVISKR